MRVKSATYTEWGHLRRTLDRLEALPVRTSTARQVVSSVLDADPGEGPSPTPWPPSWTTDPAWVVHRSRSGRDGGDALEVVSTHRWWIAEATTGPISAALTRLWRHSTAVAFAARRLAREANELDPDAVTRAGMLHALGLWALAAVAPEALVAWYAAGTEPARADLERQWFGTDRASLGKILALRWGCEPLVVEAAWLHADLETDLGSCSLDLSRLRLIQQAHAIASTTPWAPGAELARDLGTLDPRVRILMAEVQSRCGSQFADLDASPREERLTRDNARLRLLQARQVEEIGQKDRFLQARLESSTTQSVEEWAERAGLAWCGEPGVAAARVVWDDPNISSQSPTDSRPPDQVVPLGEPDRPAAFVHLWTSGQGVTPADFSVILPYWNAWAIEVLERSKAREQFEGVIQAHRGRVAREGPARERLMLDALGEFAAGAGHELNNPLAVIMGRAQLLLARHADADSVRSLRAIIAQAQRAARILRDLMYVARPPEPRPRPCQPDEIVRACLRDLQAEAEARGIRIVADVRDGGLRAWIDPDPLRQVADILTRNSLEATPTGGSVQFSSSHDGRNLRWVVHDNGRGIGPVEGLHLFDPFYCGRQAGRGLGLGLPRAARIVAQAGGELKWTSTPGHGTTFVVTLPWQEFLEKSEEREPGRPKTDRALPSS